MLTAVALDLTPHLHMAAWLPPVFLTSPPCTPLALLQELAWSSRALLVNANCCSVLAGRGRQVVMVRGAVAEAALQQQPAGDNSQKALAAAQQVGTGVAAGTCAHPCNLCCLVRLAH